MLVNEDTLLAGDKTVPLGSVNRSDEFVPMLPSCSADDNFDGPLAPSVDCNIAADVKAFCGWYVFEFNIMFSEPIMPVALDVVVGLSGMAMGCISDVASFINKLLANPMPGADAGGINVDTGLEFALLFPPLVELLVADDSEFPEAPDDRADDCCCCS